MHFVSATKDPSSDNPANSNLQQLATALNASELAEAQSLADEMSKQGNLLTSLDAHLNQQP